MKLRESEVVGTDFLEELQEFVGIVHTELNSAIGGGKLWVAVFWNSTSCFSFSRCKYSFPSALVKKLFGQYHELLKGKTDKTFVQLSFGFLFSSKWWIKKMILERLWKNFFYLSIAITSSLNSLRSSLWFSWACRGLFSVLHHPILKRLSPWPWLDAELRIFFSTTKL